MLQNPLISICIPIYNAAEFIEETISCFINQSYKNWELILQDDCSTDGTWDLINQKYANNAQIKIYQNDVNFGIGKNWNKAYEKVRGEVVVIFNADDLVENNFLENGIECFQKNLNVDLVFNSYIKSDEIKSEDLITTAKSYKGVTNDLINVNQRPFYRIHWNYTLVKKASLDRLKNSYGLFYPTQVCDAMLWFEAYKQKLTGYYSGEIIGTYRMHENNNSKIPLGEFESTLLWMMPIYPKIFKEKTKPKWNTSLILFCKYFYACLRYGKKPKIRAIINIIKYA